MAWHFMVAAPASGGNPRLRLGSVPPHHTMGRISLRTASLQQARSRAAELDLAKGAITEQSPVLRWNVKAQDMPALYKRAFERELDRVIISARTNMARRSARRSKKVCSAAMSCGRSGTRIPRSPM